MARAALARRSARARLRLGHWRPRGPHIWRPRRARSAHRPPAAASCGASGEVAAVAAEAVVFAGGRGEGRLPAQEGECYAGRRAPRPLPGGRPMGRGRGSERRRGRGFPHLPAAPRGHPSREGDGGLSRLALCAAPWRPQRRPGGFVLARPGRDRGVPSPGAPSPGAPPQLPRARRRRLLPPLGLPSGSRAGGGGGSPSAGAGGARALGAQGRRGPLTIRPGAPRARAPLHFLLGAAAGARPELEEQLGEGRQGGCWVTGGESRAPSAAGRPLPAPPRLAPGPGRPHLGLAKGCPPGAAVIPGGSLEGRFEPGPAPSPQKGGVGEGGAETEPGARRGTAGPPTPSRTPAGSLRRENSWGHGRDGG